MLRPKNSAKTGLGFLFNPGLKPGAIIVSPLRGAGYPFACVPKFTAMDVSSVLTLSSFFLNKQNYDLSFSVEIFLRVRLAMDVSEIGTQKKSRYFYRDFKRNLFLLYFMKGNCGLAGLYIRNKIAPLRRGLLAIFLFMGLGPWF